MPRLPNLQGGASTRVVTDAFRGRNHNIRIADGELYETYNLSADHYPLLSTRRPRGVKATLTNPAGMLEKDALCYVAGGTLFVNDLATSVTGLSSGEKQLVSMGAYIVIFPDKRYYNTENPADSGYLEASWNVTGNVSYAPCDVDGVPYTLSSTGDTAPADPAGGDYWLDTGSGSLQQYSEAQGVWTQVETVYTRVSFPTQGQLPALFKEGDGVEIAGLDYDLDGTKFLYGVGGESGSENDWIVLIGLAPTTSSEGIAVSIERSLPEMDFVVECQNRLWGCFYGRAGGDTVNELYCSALGDFRNWRQYQGLSTDSWAASVGSDGQWTGAVNYLGHPVFFKENRIHTITVSAAGAHRVDETVCRGVQRGSHKSLTVVGETLYYKSVTDVCAWQGGFPQSVSGQLGDAKYRNAVGGAFGAKYYLSMQGEDEAWSLFTYDRGICYREDELRALCFAAVGEELWCIDADTCALLAINGTQGETEEELSWALETGVLSYEYPDKKYLFRYDIRLVLDGEARISMEYDSSGIWVQSGTIRMHGTGTAVVPVRPRRCDHLRLRLEGTGPVKIFSIARILEVGSDV